MIFVGAAFIFFIFAFCLYANWQAVKNDKQRVLFWQAWMAALLFPFVLCISYLGQQHQSSTYKSQLAETNASYINQLLIASNSTATLSNQLTEAVAKFDHWTNLIYRYEPLANWGEGEFERSNYSASKDLFRLCLDASVEYNNQNKYDLVYEPIVAANELMLNPTNDSAESLTNFYRSLEDMLVETGTYRKSYPSNYFWEMETLYLIKKNVPPKAVAIVTNMIETARSYQANPPP